MIILNLIFFDNHLTYPTKWCLNKLIVLFKKGIRFDCGNYRGISIGDTFGKLYGKLLCNRLKMWMHVDKCQAGAQESRDCIEHVLALRLIIDYAKQEKQKLFIVFVDFNKAYDRVPRKTMLDTLKSLGCGYRMLRAIMATYKKTANILNSEIINSTIGVKQEAPMSCTLFIIYLDKSAKMMKMNGNDSFLEDHHIMMLMDDTVLFGTSREIIIKKFNMLMAFCESDGMVVNEKKTKLMVINGSSADRKEIVAGKITVKHDGKSYYRRWEYE